MYKDIQEHAFTRDLVWFREHPNQEPDYYNGSRNMIKEALDELADCYNYISHCNGESRFKLSVLTELNSLYNIIASEYQQVNEHA